MTSLRFLSALLFMSCIAACKRQHTLFEKISSSHSGIDFSNKIIENDSINPLSVVNIYNGGGVGIGDFNNDGLQDIYFTGNMVGGRLYLNRGSMKFEDVTSKAEVEGKGRWARGVAVIDINNDGLMDIYICNTIYKDSIRRKNILYINKGIDKDGVPHFEDMAAAYGLDIHVQSTMASFFDYDNDGDLDMYLTVNEAFNGGNASVFQQRSTKSVNPSVGRLFRNDQVSGVSHGVFHDVSKEAGMTYEGYGHAATVCDINNDGWKDIYVSNDFLSENILYINNHDGTFTNRAKEYFKHTSFNSMGQDVTDINNDGLVDVVELDMNPKDNYRKKMMLSANNYNIFQNFERYGYQYQYVRNTLQLNQGPRILENDSVGAPVFSDIGFMSGVAETDWSWTPLITDFDNDGYRDLIVTNGFPRDVSDHDFVAYRNKSESNESQLDLLDKIPVIKLANYAFKNTGDLHFRDVSESWGMTAKSFSNGAVCADLDNDGDMDIVINNINEEAFVYENLRRNDPDTVSHFLQIKFRGSKDNIEGLGAWADVYYAGSHQLYENNPYRGYLSTGQCLAHFGLGKISLLDSVVIRWPGGRKQTLTNVPADQVLTANVNDANDRYSWAVQALVSPPLFKEVTKAAGINYNHTDFDFIDFNIQTTLPHKLSEYCPALAAGDVDDNGFDDLIIGGNFNNPGTILLQQRDGKFISKQLETGSDSLNTLYKDEGMVLFDANGDGTLDLYVASGGFKSESNSPDYQDRLYINEGKGRFTLAADALPVNHTSKLCVRAMDYNKDGKPDIFVSGRVDPWHYPKPVSSFIFRNDSKNGKIKFTDVTDEVAPDLKNIGLICDALFTDFDNDGQNDLVLTGEWMPVTFLKNINGKFKNVTSSTGLAGQTGWWNSIVGGDFRHVGRTDYIVGNLGQNSLYKASERYPVFITAKDFDNNGGYEAIPSLFLQAQDGTPKEFPSHGRDDIIDKLPALKKRFNSYHSFATATMDSILTKAQRNGAQRMSAVNLKSCYLRNEGNGKFTAVPLPEMAQVSALNGMVADDFDGDGNLDVLINGNDYATEVSIGRYDALNGLLLKGNGKGDFVPLSMRQSGIFIPGDGKALVRLRSASGDYLIAASQYKDALKIFQLRRHATNIPFQQDDLFALVRYHDGSVEKKEFYCGSSFLSQSSTFFSVSKNAESATIYDNNGRSRKIQFNESK